MDTRTDTGFEEEVIGAADYLKALWARKWTVLAATLIGALAAGVTAWVVPKEYQASVVVLPVSDSGDGGQLGGLSSLASQFGGLASLAGISLGENTRKVEAVAVLQSEELTQTFVRDNNLLPVLFWRKWDTRRKTWKVSGSDEVPTLWKANELFKRIRQVTVNSKTGVLTIAITWRDPAVAAAWANGLVRLTNAYLRDKAIRESERNIAYLSGEAVKTSIVEAKQAIYTLLATEINQEMMARGSDEYALKVIDPAFVPERPTSPKKMLWILVGAALGFGIAAGVVLLRTDMTNAS